MKQLLKAVAFMATAMAAFFGLCALWAQVSQRQHTGISILIIFAVWLVGLFFVDKYIYKIP